MKPIQNAIDILFQSSRTESAWKIDLIKQWPTIIGNLHEKVSLQKINSNSVVLGVHDSSWMQELYLLSKLILKKINNHLKEPRIINIRFKCLEKRKQNHTAAPKKTEPQQKPIKLTVQEKKALQRIDDEILSSALQQFLSRCHQ